MIEDRITVAVTGLNATDNPAPGVGVIRSLRLALGGRARIIGLAYDAMDPGIYAKDLVDDVFLVPYPSQGSGALLARMRHVHALTGVRVVIPTLDSELCSFIDSAPRLAELGIGTYLPTRAQLDLRSKARLAELGRRAGIRVPRTAVVSDASELLRIHEEVPYPFFVKGAYYGATLARTLDDALAAFHKIVAEWGLPVVVQAGVWGEEVNVVAVGDGEGGLVGAVPMKKTLLTDKGKGWAGIAIRDGALLALAESFARATAWRGPFEVEAIRDRDGQYHLIEVNPRFPAWVYLSAAAGMNLPAAVVELASERPVAKLEGYAVGTMFVRISIDQIADLSDFQRIVTGGEILRAAS